MHGIRTNLLTTGARPIKVLSTNVIGIVVTAPDAPADIKSKLSTGVVATNNAQTFTSKLTGAAGDTITIAFVDPGANSAALAVVVAGTAITVNLATSAGGAVTTTATLLAAAIAASAPAHALVGVANTGASTGAGVVAPMAPTKLAGGLNEPFPLNARTLILDVRSAIAKVGATGTAKTALEGIADQCSPAIVLVRVAVDAENQDELVNAGIALLLGAQAEFGLRPRLLGAPGLDTQEVTTELALTARKLRGFTYAMAIGADETAARAYRQEFGAGEMMLLWPASKPGSAIGTVARALGLRARIDSEFGFHKSLSNVAVDGVTGLEKDVYFDINSDTSTAALLNAGDITTMIRQDGYRFWGNRTCSDEPLFAFETTVRTSQVLQDEIADGLFWAIDKPLTKVLIKDILETINARFRALVAEGKLIGARAWYDPALNSEVDLSAGKLVIDYDFTPCAPLESLTLNQRITQRYYANFADLAA